MVAEVGHENFFGLNKRLLKFAGLWVPDQGETFYLKCWYYFFNILVNGFSIGIIMPSDWLALAFAVDSLENTMKNASITVMGTLGALKIVIWLRRRKEIFSVMEVLEEMSTKYEAIDGFVPEKIIKTEKRFKNATTLGFLSFALLVSISGFFSAILIFLMDSDKYTKNEALEFGSNETRFVYVQKLPYSTWMPFDYHSSRLRFFMAVIYACFTPFQETWVIIAFDTLFIALVSYVSAQLKMLGGAFKTIRARCVRRLKMKHLQVLYDPAKLNEEMTMEMNKCVKHLQVIFESCKKLEDIFSYLTLVQVLLSEIILCACLYLVSSISLSSKSFVTEVIYLLTVTIQTMLYCFFGNRITITSGEISMALYKGDWLSSSNSFKKSMLITMARTRRPIYLTIGKFSPLTLSTFVMIAKGSYSFFAVLKKYNADSSSI